jgi:hypothetical protein
VAAGARGPGKGDRAAVVGQVRSPSTIAVRNALRPSVRPWQLGRTSACTISKSGENLRRNADSRRSAGPAAASQSLTNGVDQDGRPLGVGPKVVLGEHEGADGSEAAVQLDDPWPPGARDVLLRQDQIVTGLGHVLAGAFQQRVVVRREDVDPRQREQYLVQFAGPPVVVGNQFGQQAVQGRPTEIGFELLGDAERPAFHRQLLSVFVMTLATSRASCWSRCNTAGSGGRIVICGAARTSACTTGEDATLRNSACTTGLVGVRIAFCPAGLVAAAVAVVATTAVSGAAAAGVTAAIATGAYATDPAAAKAPSATVALLVLARNSESDCRHITFCAQLPWIGLEAPRL